MNVSHLASLWKLPVLYVIENNRYGMGTSAERHAAGELYRRGEPYGIPGERVDGMDVLSVQAAARQAMDYVRSGSGPYLLEMMTYRYRGHSMSDPGKYRSKDEVEKFKTEQDPIENLKKILIAEGASENDLKPMEKRSRTSLPKPHNLPRSCRSLM